MWPCSVLLSLNFNQEFSSFCANVKMFHIFIFDSSCLLNQAVPVDVPPSCETDCVFGAEERRARTGRTFPGSSTHASVLQAVLGQGCCAPRSRASLLSVCQVQLRWSSSSNVVMRHLEVALTSIGMFNGASPAVVLLLFVGWHWQRSENAKLSGSIGTSTTLCCNASGQNRFRDKRSTVDPARYKLRCRTGPPFSSLIGHWIGNSGSFRHSRCRKPGSARNSCWKWAKSICLRHPSMSTIGSNTLQSLDWLSLIFSICGIGWTLKSGTALNLLSIRSYLRSVILFCRHAKYKVEKIRALEFMLFVRGKQKKNWVPFDRLQSCITVQMWWTQNLSVNIWQFLPLIRGSAQVMSFFAIGW